MQLAEVAQTREVVGPHCCAACGQSGFSAGDNACNSAAIPVVWLFAFNAAARSKGPCINCAGNDFGAIVAVLQLEVGLTIQVSRLNIAQVCIV